MGKLIKLTFLTDLGSCLLMLIIFTFSDSFGAGLYVIILIFGNILIPTIIAVLFFLMLRKKTTLKTPLKTILLQAIILMPLYVLGLYLWATIDSLLFEKLTWENIQQDFNSQFSGFLPVIIAQAIQIPVLDHWLTKQKNAQHSL
jgi:hypothetical protein